jgi:hypothetical protein
VGIDHSVHLSEVEEAAVLVEDNRQSSRRTSARNEVRKSPYLLPLSVTFSFDPAYRQCGSKAGDMTTVRAACWQSRRHLNHNDSTVREREPRGSYSCNLPSLYNKTANKPATTAVPAPTNHALTPNVPAPSDDCSGGSEGVIDPFVGVLAGGGKLCVAVPLTFCTLK